MDIEYKSKDTLQRYVVMIELPYILIQIVLMLIMAFTPTVYKVTTFDFIDNQTTKSFGLFVEHGEKYKFLHEMDGWSPIIMVLLIFLCIFILFLIIKLIVDMSYAKNKSSELFLASMLIHLTTCKPFSYTSGHDYCCQYPDNDHPNEPF
ncbi:hypothetical protein RF11_00911 [Thelohanellus kitauei]|uniref:Uncharacterized protein n=1 Tax=Thelohanellus kitauei TaxID=669202 RepID=A0A0C2MMI2_THEKT|nr:hypothetical protein RF11_00911 [Thelohanellus kitauei]